MTYLKRLIKDLNTSIGEKQTNGTMRKKRVSTRALGTNPRAKGTNPRAKNISQNDKSGVSMKKKSFIVLELTEDEAKELNRLDASTQRFQHANLVRCRLALAQNKHL